MSEPTKQGVTISSGDKAIDRSQTTIDNSSRVSETVDNHSVSTSSVSDSSVRTTSATDNSSRTVSIDASDNRRKSHVTINGGTLLGVVALIVVAIVVVWDRSQGGSVSPRGPAPSEARAANTPALSSEVDDPVGSSRRAAPSAAAIPGVPAKPVSARQAGGARETATATPATSNEGKANDDFIDVEASGQPQDGLAPGSQEAYGDAIDTAMLLAKAHFLAWQRGEITHVREIEGIRTLKADTMLIAKGQVRGGRTLSRSTIDEFQATGVVHLKVRFPVAADVTPQVAR